MLDYAEDLRATVARAAPVLRALPAEALTRPRVPGKWSPKETLGHLIDSAANNHQRFVRAHFRDHLVFDGYDQDAWVAAQGYQQAPWPDLVALWEAYNRHLAYLMEQVPEAVRLRQHTQHNFHQIAWQTVPKNQPATLDYFMRDYVAHLNHHLAQLGVDAT